MPRPRIAICFFGIPRSLENTIENIDHKILQPARSIGEVKIFSHFFEQSSIHNPRTGEFGNMDTSTHTLLPNDWLELETPDLCLSRWDFEAIKSFGDFWGDDFYALRNLVHQLHSLHCVTDAVLKADYDLVIFCRPDLYYFDSFEADIKAALKTPYASIRLPAWQPWLGLNDRFAIVRGRRAISAYGQRIESALDFCKWRNAPLHSESLLHYRLRRKFIPHTKIGLKGARVRANGIMVEEDFKIRPAYKRHIKSLLSDVRFLLEKTRLY